MKPVSKQQIAAIYTAVRTQGLDKAQLVSQFTSGRTESVSAMHWQEAFELLKKLNHHKPQTAEQKVKDIRKEKMARKIFAMAHEMGWIDTRTKATKKGLEEVNDYGRVYEWILKYGYLHKNLRDYTYEQLPALVSQFEKVYFTIVKTNKK